MATTSGVLLIQDRPPPFVQTLLPGYAGTVSAYVALALDGLLASPHEPTDAAGHRRHRTLVRALLRHSGRAAFDLRFVVRPGGRPTVEVALLTRTWASTADAAIEFALRVREDIRQLLPAELSTTTVTDVGHMACLLDPYSDEPVQAATVTKRELLAAPVRPDSTAPFHFAVSPFGGQRDDWAPLYSALARSPLPITVSLALFPVQVPAAFCHELTAWADYYGRLGEEGQLPGGLYYGPRRLARARSLRRRGGSGPTARPDVLVRWDSRGAGSGDCAPAARGPGRAARLGSSVESSTEPAGARLRDSLAAGCGR